MQVTKKSRMQVRLQNIIFVALFLGIVGLLAWLSNRYAISTDWTADARNSLSASSTELLKTIDGPIEITAFVRNDPQSATLTKRITEIVSRYQKHNEAISLRFINPDTEPQMTRDLGIRVEGELVIRYGERSENLQNLTEQSLTNALQRVARSSERYIVFLEGHGERNPRGRANHDLGDWATQLQNKGLNIQGINLANNPRLPDNTSILVIASPQVNLLPGEFSIISNYLAKGGNLLWLADPGELHGLGGLAEQLGIEFQPGIIVDPTSLSLGIQDPRFTIITEYGSQAITANFDSITLFPQATGIELVEGSDWQADPFLTSAANSWSETSELKGELELNAGEDIPGPLNIGLILTRNLGADADNSGSEQRAIVIGDGDFVSNAYLGNAGNLDLGLNLVNWLVGDENFIDIPAKTAGDLKLELSPFAAGLIGIGFLFVLPLGLLAAGLWIWWRRRQA
ncbi:GldG family protein [Sulfuriflexus mobilis]|uniref:GldG family protein n=1 Tax=Sulfuriflexus mobilis TaxID=1811807 RepID=UPI000F8381E9|nr:GldG family protein [Sulfuriflexus mobilis]